MLMRPPTTHPHNPHLQNIVAGRPATNNVFAAAIENFAAMPRRRMPGCYNPPAGTIRSAHPPGIGGFAHACERAAYLRRRTRIGPVKRSALWHGILEIRSRSAHSVVTDKAVATDNALA